jgi:hypothetical protein
MSLLNDISRCEHVMHCLQNGGQHPCRAIVMAQQVAIEQRQLPEPWSGHLETAPILFIGANPSISDADECPHWNWDDATIQDFFYNRFGGGARNWVQDGIRPLLAGNENGYGRSVRYWAAIRNRAMELFDRNVVPGMHYAITEVVHCKSRNSQGVHKAQNTCGQKFLRRILQSAQKARILVLVGTEAVHGWNAFIGAHQLPEDMLFARDEFFKGPRQICDHGRIVLRIPHTNARVRRTIRDCLTQEQLGQTRDFLTANE